MKRSLSVLLIIAMIASIFTVAIPASAARDESASSSEEKSWAGWTAISTAEDLCSISSGSADSPTKYYLTADIVLNKNCKKTSPKNVVLDGDGHSITVTDERAFVYTNAGNMEISNLVLNGTVDISNEDDAFNSPFSMYNTTGWVKMENIVSNVNITYSKNTNRSQSVSGVWQSAGSGSSFKNVTYNGTIIIEEGALVDYMGAIVGSATGATFENVINNGDIICTGEITTQRVIVETVTAADGTTTEKTSPAILTEETKSTDENGNTYVSKKVQYQYYNNAYTEIGGIVGTASGCTFTDCVNNCSIVFAGTQNTTQINATTTLYNPDGTILKQEVKKTDENGNEVSEWVETTTSVKRKADVEIDYLGGFVGQTKGTCTFENCTNNALMVLNGYDVRYSFAGGFVGHINGSATFTDCKNNCDIKATKDGTWYIAGFAGYTGKTGTYVFERCVNNGKLTSYNTGKGSGSNCGVGGFVGYAEGSTTFNITFTDCVNNGDINTNSSAKMKAEHWGGFIANGVSISNTHFIRCINAGDIVRPFAETDSFYEGTAGFIGGFRLLGKSWMKVPDADISFTDCINLGDVSGIKAGGFYGCTTEIDLDDTITVDRLKLTFTNCVNAGNVTGTKMAGGFGGGYNTSNGDGPFTITVKNCANGGNINGDSYVGGLFGMIATRSAVTIQSCVNYGTVGGVDGDGNPTSGTAAGFVATGPTMTVQGCVNIGDVAGKMSHPIMVGSFSSASTGNKFLVGTAAEKEYTGILAVADATAMLVAIDQMGVLACNYQLMLDNIKEYRTYSGVTHIDKTEDKSGFTKLYAACDAAEAAILENIDDPLTYTQKEANESYLLLLEALANLKEKVDFTALNALMTKANDKLADGNTYSDTSLAKLKAQMEAADALIEQGDDADKKEVNTVATTLSKAIDTLRRVRPMNENGGTTTEPDDDTQSTDKPEGDSTDATDATDATDSTDATEAPSDTSGQSDTQPVEGNGCGSAIGGAAVVLTAVIALGAGIAFKKKED